MKNYILNIVLGSLIGLSLVSCRPTADNKQSFEAFYEVLVSEITPKGWLEEWLIRQRDGLGLHRAESGHPYNTGLWTTVIPKADNPVAQNWWAYEQTAYLIDGLYRCGLLLKDSALISLGKENVDYVINHPRSDGRLGPDCLGDNQWAFSIFARVLMADYAETQNPQILQALTNHYLALPDSLTNRQACIIESLCWTYEHTGDQRLLDKAQQIWKTYSIDEHPDNEFFKQAHMIAGDSVCVHGVTAAEVGKQPVSLYNLTGNTDYLDAATGFFEGVRKYHELADGIPSSYEKLFGRHPEELHETCDISDFTWSYGNILLATGDAAWADRIERAVFNAGMGAINKDFKAHQYFSAPNQLIATQYSSMASYGEGGKSRQAYRPGFDTECCSGNVHRIIPNYASRLWMKDRNNGIVAAMYAPSVLQTTLSDGMPVMIEEVTDYPFSGTILFRINPDKPASFPFTLRIPEWSKGASVQVNNEEALTPAPGTYFMIERQFKAGDEIKLVIPMPVRTEVSEYDGIFVNRGPLLFALSIREDAREITDQEKTSVNFPAYDIKPASAWNFALSKDIAQGIEVEEKELKGFPWDTGNSPVVLKMKAFRVPDWKATSTTPSLPAKGFKVSEAENIEMIPAGSTRIRMCVFPMVLPAADVPAIWVLGDNLSEELADKLESDLAQSLIFGRNPSRQKLTFHWKNCPSGSGEVYSELEKLEKTRTEQEQSGVLLLNCGLSDLLHGKQSLDKPDTTAYRNNLKGIIAAAEKHHLEVLWYAIPFDKDKKVNDLILIYNQVAGRVMAEANIRTVDFYHYWEMQMKDKGQPSLNESTLQSRYLAESLSQWWTASARSNRSIERVKLWETLPPYYVYRGDECINAFARVERVAIPELEIFYPQERKAAGVKPATAVIFFPGGGYKYLGFLRNARELAEILNPHGIAVIGLKYRTGRTPDIPLADAKRVVRFVKAHAKAWGLNPERIGIAGQSAGAHLALNLISNLDTGQPDATDPVERESCRPAFVAVFSSWNFLSMESPFRFGPDTPPFFVRHAKDDNSFPLVCKIVNQLEAAHAYYDVLFLEKGGHGAFEISEPNTGRDWPQDFMEWLRRIHLTD